MSGQTASPHPPSDHRLHGFLIRRVFVSQEPVHPRLPLFFLVFFFLPRFSSHPITSLPNRYPQGTPASSFLSSLSPPSLLFRLFIQKPARPGGASRTCPPLRRLFQIAQEPVPRQSYLPGQTPLLRDFPIRNIPRLQSPPPEPTINCASAAPSVFSLFFTLLPWSLSLSISLALFSVSLVHRATASPPLFYLLLWFNPSRLVSIVTTLSFPFFFFSSFAIIMSSLFRSYAAAGLLLAGSNSIFAAAAPSPYAASDAASAAAWVRLFSPSTEPLYYSLKFIFTTAF